ncbi:hypothetical protein M758_10G008900 [Ceratodon purpureus]|uniref:Uncharacterized protein n=1 Tax=Ceratodon purpureus TaxID=3225 RepID=A0A8T0GMB2_CERPU|nr:hypothetical protein KC19_10G009500 [Ceratodon purpureus]KAG0602354.1 hypothetical protein M758_10G008900 [Ceratodon purpureus]
MSESSSPTFKMSWAPPTSTPCCMIRINRRAERPRNENILNFQGPNLVNTFCLCFLSALSLNGWAAIVLSRSNSNKRTMQQALEIPLDSYRPNSIIEQYQGF